MNGGISEASDKPRCAWLCSYTPVELIKAAGFEPIRIVTEGPGGPRADSLLPRSFCPYVRACLEHRLGGRALPVVSAIGCDCMRRLADALPVTIRVSLPRTPSGKATPDQTERFSLELRRTWERLHRLLGKTPPSPRESAWFIRASIEEYRRFKRELLRLQSLARDGSISFSRAFIAVSRAMASPPDRFESCLGDLRCLTEPEKSTGGVRVVLSGANLLDASLLEVVEQAGGRILEVDCCNWSRWAAPGQNANDLPGQHSSLDDVLYWLAESYLGRYPCPRQTTAFHRAELLAERVRDTGASGVVLFAPKFCDVGLYEAPVVKKHLTSQGIPCLELEVDYGWGNSGQARTRVEAFLEMLEVKAG